MAFLKNRSPSTKKQGERRERLIQNYKDGLISREKFLVQMGASVLKTDSLAAKNAKRTKNDDLTNDNAYPTNKEKTSSKSQPIKVTISRRGDNNYSSVIGNESTFNENSDTFLLQSDAIPANINSTNPYKHRKVGVKPNSGNLNYSTTRPIIKKSTKCPDCGIGFNVNSKFESCKLCDSLTHRRCIKGDGYDEDNYICHLCVSKQVHTEEDSNVVETDVTVSDINENNEKNNDGVEENNDKNKDDMDENNDLMLHIKRNNLPYVERQPTRSDGNCWYDAISDQVVLNKIDNLPKNHKGIRKLVCDNIKKLPQAKSWIKNLFGNKESKFDQFVQKHRSNKEWTDNLGIMCQATALILNRKIFLIGTAIKNNLLQFWRQILKVKSCLHFSLVTIKVNTIKV